MPTVNENGPVFSWPYLSQYVCDFEICCSVEELRRTLDLINKYRYHLSTVTQSGEVYTVFFWRPAHG